jgi:hypothetical protein
MHFACSPYSFSSKSKTKTGSPPCILHARHVDSWVKAILKLVVFVCALTEVALKRVASFLNSRQANFHSKNLGLFFGARSRFFYFDKCWFDFEGGFSQFGKCQFDLGAIFLNSTNWFDFRGWGFISWEPEGIYTYTQTKNRKITNDRLKNHPTLKKIFKPLTAQKV